MQPEAPLPVVPKPGVLDRADQLIATPRDLLLLIATVVCGLVAVLALVSLLLAVVQTNLGVAAGSGLLFFASSAGTLQAGRRVRPARARRQAADQTEHDQAHGELLDTLGRPERKWETDLRLKELDLDQVRLELDARLTEVNRIIDANHQLERLRLDYGLKTEKTQQARELRLLREEVQAKEREASAARGWTSRERRRDRAQELERDAQQIRGRLDELDKQLTHQMNVLIEQFEERRRFSPTVEMSERIGAFKLLRDEMERIAGDTTLHNNEKRRQIKFLQEAFLRVGRHD